MAKIKYDKSTVDINLIAHVAGSFKGAYLAVEKGETYIFVDDVSQEALEAAMVDKDVIADAQARVTATAAMPKPIEERVAALEAKVTTLLAVRL